MATAPVYHTLSNQPWQKDPIKSEFKEATIMRITINNIQAFLSKVFPPKKNQCIFFLWIKIFIRKAYKLPMKQLNKYSCSGSVVRPIISASRAEDSGSNPGRSI